MSEDLLYLKQEKLKILEEKARLKRNLPHLYGWKSYKWQREFLESTNKTCLLTAANQIGKDLSIWSSIPTPNGYTLLKDIQVGDKVFSRSGEVCEVLAIPYEGVQPYYLITFNDGTTVEAGKEHLWITKGYDERFRKNWYTRARGKYPNESYNKWVVKTTEQIIKDGCYSPETSPQKAHVIPMCEPVQYEEKDLFDPYYLGLYIGNGSTQSICINGEDTDLEPFLAKYGNKHNIKDSRNILRYGINTSTLKILEQLEVTEISFNKKIPQKYLLGGINQRKDLLAGLMDTDGTCSENGQSYEYYTTSKTLAYQVQELVCSLGGLAEVKEKDAWYLKDGERVDCNLCYRVTLWTTFNPFKSTRKSARWRLNTRYKHERVILKIEYIGEKTGKCITVSSEDQSFLTGKEYIVTHNSSVQIRKVIDWATNVNLWPSLWSTEPRVFWYLYPARDVATAEFNDKWVPDFLPKNEMKDHPIYGWKEQKNNRREIMSLHFNSGVTVYFKTYEQDVHNLQTATVHYIATDEELPENLYNELNFRRNATNGYFSMVFTATRGQEMWRLAMEPRPGEEEKLKTAFKRTVSLYECKYFEDGTPSHWTDQRIAETVANCSSDEEVQRRVLGRFIKTDGRKYPTFSRLVNVCAPRDIPYNWNKYVGVDIGAGGPNNHPSTITFIAVSPDFSMGLVYKHWRGDKELTTMSDVANKYLELKGSDIINAAYYDYHAKDFKTITDRMGLSFIAAEKDHRIGEYTINTLFKNKMVYIFDIPENEPIINELLTLEANGDKRHTKDDSADSFRYSVTKIPWDWTKQKTAIDLDLKQYKKYTPMEQATVDRMRDRARMVENRFQDEYEQSIEKELREWNEYY